MLLVLAHCWLGDRKCIRPVKSWLLVCWWWRFDYGTVLHVLPLSLPLSVLANPSSPGKMAVETERERERERDRQTDRQTERERENASCLLLGDALGLCMASCLFALFLLKLPLDLPLFFRHAQATNNIRVGARIIPIICCGWRLTLTGQVSRHAGRRLRNIHCRHLHTNMRYFLYSIFAYDVGHSKWSRWRSGQLHRWEHYSFWFVWVHDKTIRTEPDIWGEVEKAIKDTDINTRVISGQT